MVESSGDRDLEYMLTGGEIICAGARGAGGGDSDFRLYNNQFMFVFALVVCRRYVLKGPFRRQQGPKYRLIFYEHMCCIQ